MDVADSNWFANHCIPLQTIAISALRQSDDGERHGASSQSPCSRVRMAPDARRRRCSSLSSPVVVCCAAAAVQSVADRRPRVNPCPCRDRKPLQVIANFSNHRHWCTSEVALVGTAGARRWSVRRKGFACDSILSRLNDYRQLRLTCAAAA